MKYIHLLLLSLFIISYTIKTHASNVHLYHSSTDLAQSLYDAYQKIQADNPSLLEKIEPTLVALLSVPRYILSAINDAIEQRAWKAYHATRDKAIHLDADVRHQLSENALNMTRGKYWGAILGTTFVGVPLFMHGAKTGMDFLKKYSLTLLNKPQLVRSILTPSQVTKNLDDLLYTGKTNTQIKRIIKTAKGVVDNKKTGYFYRFNPFRDTSKGRARFENVMLWGPPGTGKTAIVEIIAKEAGMNIFMTSGGDFAKLRGKDLQQIDEIFKTMRSSNRPCILFIDEMEELFGSRAGNKSEESRQILTKLLTEFSEPSNQIMLIGATNRPEDIDEAMHRRMPVQIEVAYPNKAGRVKIFTLYKKIFFEKDSIYSKAQLAEINKVLSDQTIKSMEETMGAISPAEIANIMGTIKNRSLTDNKGIPTQAIIDEVLQDKKGQLQAIQQGFKRTDIATIEASSAA